MASIIQQGRINRDTLKALENAYGSNSDMAQWSEAVPTGVGTAIAGAGIGANVISGGIKQQKSGSVSQNIGLMNPIIEPYLLIKKKKRYYPPDENIGSIQGLPSNNFVTLGSVKGFTKVSKVHVEVEGATEEELSEIEKLLKGGVIL